MAKKGEGRSDAAADDGGAAFVHGRSDPATEGERDMGTREFVEGNPEENGFKPGDKVWTEDSKERMGDGQPSHMDLLKQQWDYEKSLAEQEE